MKLQSREISLWCGLIAVFAFMQLIWGYSFGHENSIQLIPFALHAHNTALYDSDFFVTHAAARFPNERSFFMYLLMPFGSHLEWPSYIIFAITSLLLFRALYGIAMHFLEKPLYAFSALIILIFPLNYHALGLNELFGAEISTSLLADTACAWAILHFLQQRKWSPWLLLIFGTLMHPLSGIQVFILLALTLFTQSVISGRVAQFFKMYGWQFLLYALTGGLFVVTLEMGFDNVAWDTETLFQTFYVFRNAHHYIPTEYPLKDWILLGPLYLITPLLFIKKEKSVAIFTGWIIVICIIYSILVMRYHMIPVATAQWFKATMWLEWFGIVGALFTVKTILLRLKGIDYSKAIFAASVVVTSMWLTLLFPGYDFWRKNTAYEFPFYERVTPEIDMSRAVQQYTPASSLLIQPAGMDEIKYYSLRSSFVDYKALTHTKAFLKEWSSRFELIYDINPATSKVISFDVIPLADEHFRQISTEKLQMLHTDHGIDYIVTFADVTYPLPMIYKNDKYALYQL